MEKKKKEEQYDQGGLSEKAKAKVRKFLVIDYIFDLKLNNIQLHLHPFQFYVIYLLLFIAEMY